MAKMVDRVKEAMRNQDQIRNIAIAAHIDHGKCVHPDSKVQTADGSITTAEKLYEQLRETGELARDTDDETVYEVTDTNAVSLNKETGELEHKPVTHAWKLNGGQLIDITLRNGQRIRTTPEHKYIVIDNMDFVEKEARDLTTDDTIVTARTTDVTTWDEPHVKEEILRGLAGNNFYLTLDDDLADTVKQAIQDDGTAAVTDDLPSSLDKDSFYHGMWQNRFQAQDLVALTDRYDLDPATVYDHIDDVTWRNGDQSGKSADPITLPSSLEALYNVAGYMVGDGTRQRFVVADDNLEEQFRKAADKVGVDLTRRDYDGQTPELTTNTTLTRVLEALFDYPEEQKSHNVTTSTFLERSPDHLVAAYIQAYYDCDGTVETNRRAISLTTVSDDMRDSLQLLLQRFGCTSIKHDQTLYITGVSARRFVNQIGFGLERKQDKARDLADDTHGNRVTDTIPFDQDTLEGLRETSKNALGQHYYKYENQDQKPTYDTAQRYAQQAQTKLKQRLDKLTTGDLAYVDIQDIDTTHSDTVYDFTVETHHNFVADGTVIHNTTFSDNLLEGAGMMSQELAGEARELDFHDDEQERGITIDSASVSMVHEVNDQDHLINLIDTPGHVDFGGDVTRAMRAVDGCIVLVCAVEGVMPQTETVLRQALKERVKPILFINKVDRLIKELKLSPEEMQERFTEIINEVNKLIKDIAEEEYGDKWTTAVKDGTVTFGSAFHNWALSIPYMQEQGIGFDHVIDAYDDEDWESLRDDAPIHEVVLNEVVKHHPNPDKAQNYRIESVWKGDEDGKVGQDLANCDPDGQVAFVVTKVVVDPQAGEICAGRLFSGTVEKGMDVTHLGTDEDVRVQQVYVYNGNQRSIVPEAPAGNIIGVAGLGNAFPGDTFSDGDMTPFEAITHIFDPVVTVAIEAKNPADLPELIEVLMQVSKEDPSVEVEIDQDTGEHLLHGMGELHLEVIENRIKDEKGVEIETSPPIVVFRESIQSESDDTVMGKSPNKHNKVFFRVEPLSDEFTRKFQEEKLPEGRLKKGDRDEQDILKDELGMDAKAARNVRDIYKGNMLVDETRGIVHINEIMEMVQDMFEDVMDNGPLAQEPGIGVKVVLDDVKLHEDAIHRGPAQMYPAIRDSIRGAMSIADPILYEPVQTLMFEAPAQYTGDISTLIANKRGQLINMTQEGKRVEVKGKMPVAEMFGMASELRSATGGRGSSFLIDQEFEPLPHNLQDKIINDIRERKGIKHEYEDE